MNVNTQIRSLVVKRTLVRSRGAAPTRDERSPKMETRRIAHRRRLPLGGSPTLLIALALVTSIAGAQTTELRTWTDATGKHQTRARLLEFRDGQVRLQHEDGREIDLSVDKLSKEDQEFLNRQHNRAQPAGGQSRVMRNLSTGEERIVRVVSVGGSRGQQRARVEDRDTGETTWISLQEWTFSARSDERPAQGDAPASRTSTAGESERPSAAPASSPPASTRSAQVLAVGSGIDSSTAERNALAHALERTIGVMVDAETIVRDDQLVRDEILTYTKGYIQEYNVLRSWQQDDISHVEVFARVSVSKLTEKLKMKAATEQELDGRLMQVQVELEQQYEKNACEMFRRAVAELRPDRMLTLALADKPKMERSNTGVKLTLTCTVTADLHAWENIYSGLRPLLKRISLASATHQVPTQGLFSSRFHHFIRESRQRLANNQTEEKSILSMFETEEGFRLPMFVEQSIEHGSVVVDVFLIPAWLKPELVSCWSRMWSGYLLRINLLDEAGSVVACAHGRIPHACRHSYRDLDFFAPLPHQGRGRVGGLGLDGWPNNTVVLTFEVALSTEEVGRVTKYAVTWVDFFSDMAQRWNGEICRRCRKKIKQVEFTHEGFGGLSVQCPHCERSPLFEFSDKIHHVYGWEQRMLRQ